MHIQVVTMLFQQHSEVITVRHYVYARSLLSPSVRPSVTFVYCIQTPKDIVKFLSRPSIAKILVFNLERRYPILRGIPSTGTQNTRTVGKICDFELKLPFIMDMDMTVAMER